MWHENRVVLDHPRVIEPPSFREMAIRQRQVVLLRCQAGNDPVW